MCVISNAIIHLLGNCALDLVQANWPGSINTCVPQRLVAIAASPGRRTSNVDVLLSALSKRYET